MDWIMLSIGGAGLILFIISFFLKDRSSDTADELQELSMSLYQELSQLKKRTKLLEEELMIDSSSSNKPVKPKQINEILVNQVLSLHKQGMSPEQISNLSSLHISDVLHLIKSRS
ncbi:hypothetical protein KP77_23150 [Jeotgalibacillus alimentarius]|uniref:Resolvase HTH domain-containing protein n=1 Tax=Jeotgalibacillus alimentarius TaxID=135826 RepID=A0A0C2VX57_9BACL|nr:hypothetical protein [Jeotgalibacillus alimentarius]KIL48528.1 hypothetical protein KP77_23150 [Jeotgalibacillus alimentarius]